MLDQALGLGEIARVAEAAEIAGGRHGRPGGGARSGGEVRPALGAFLASTIYRGHEGVAAWYAETNEPWAALRAEPHRVLDAGERTVVLVGLRARVPGGRVEVDAEIAHVLTIRDGRIVRLDGYEEPEAPLAAAGLRE